MAPLAINGTALVSYEMRLHTSRRPDLAIAREGEREGDNDAIIFHKGVAELSCADVLEVPLGSH